MVVAAVAASGWLLGLIWALRRRAVRQVAERAQLSVWETIRVATGSGRVTEIAAAAAPTAGSPSMRYGVAILMGVCLAAIGRMTWLG